MSLAKNHGLAVLMLCAAIAAVPAAARVSNRQLTNDFNISSTAGHSGVVRAFFYNQTTVIEFESYPLYFSVVDSSGVEIPFQREGKFARLRGRHEEFSASVDGKKVQFSVPKPEASAKAKIVLPGLDFAYELSGDARVTPSQIFDDGERTYLQFSATQDVPAVFVASPAGMRIVPLSPEAPYMVAKEVNREYIFVLGASKAKATYSGSSARTFTPALVPSKGVSATSANQQLPTHRKVDEGEKTGVPPQLVEAPSVTVAETPATKSDIQPVPPVQIWEVQASDVRLATTLDRWAKKAGYRLQWDAVQHVLISATTSFSGTFEEAVQKVLSTPGIRLGPYPLEACVYENTPPLLRVTRQGEQAKECPDF